VDTPAIYINLLCIFFLQFYFIMAILNVTDVSVILNFKFIQLYTDRIKNQLFKFEKEDLDEAGSK